MRTMKTGSDETASDGDYAMTGADQTRVLRVATIIVVCGLLTLGLPEGIRLLALSALLFLGAFVAASAAAVAGDRLIALHLTHWDEAAALMVASLLIGWLAGVLDNAGAGAMPDITERR